MNEVSYQNLNAVNQGAYPKNKDELKKQNAYTALNKEQIKKDSQEIAAKVKENAKENFVFKAMRAFGCDDPKKFLKLSLMTAVSMIAVMIFGNKTSNLFIKLGNILDDFLKNDKNIFGKTRNFTLNTLSSIAKGIKKNIPEFQIVKDVKEAFKNPYTIRWNFFRGYNNGGKGVFANTVRETLTTSYSHDAKKLQKALENLLGKDRTKTILQDLNNSSIDNIAFTNKLTKLIAESQNCVGDTTKLRKVFEKIDANEFSEGLADVRMDASGFIGSWVPANIVNDVIKKITKREAKILNGNLGDALGKYNAINGTMAKTIPAKLIQLIPILFTEQYTNFVNDKSTFGLFLTGNTFGIMKNVEEAPKEKKITTAVSSNASSAISWLVSMPIISSIIYGLATLKKIPGKGPLHSILRLVGRPFAIGLDKTDTTLGGVSGVLGGISRLLMIMFVFQPFIGKHIDNLCNKIFGEPYDIQKEQQKAQQKAKQEEEAKKIIPELGITQGEFIKKVQSNPKAIQELQNNPELVQKLQANPKLLLDYLDGKDITKAQETPPLKTNSTPSLSPANQNLINQAKKQNTVNPLQINQQAQTQTPKVQQQTQTPKTQPQTIQSVKTQVQANTSTQNTAANESNNSKITRDTATYIPSSQIATGISAPAMNEIVQVQYNKAMTDADKALKAAERFI